MTTLKWIVYVILALVGVVLVAAQFGLLRGAPPADLGLRDGKLKRPSKTPNSVSSQARLWPGHPQLDYAHIEPLPLVGDGPATMARLKAVCDGMPGAMVVTHEPDYLYVRFETPLMKYTDDVEFWFDPAERVVHVRSASRLGRKDFGVNRARVETIRAALTAAR